MYIEGYGNMVTYKKPVVIKTRHLLAGMVVGAMVGFYIGAYYNATRIMDSALPVDVYEPREEDGGWYD